MKKRWSRSLVKIAPFPRLGGSLGAFVFIVLAGLSLIVSLVSPQSFNGARAQVSDVFAPVIYAVNKPVQDAVALARNVTGIAEMQATNTRLQKENAKLRLWYQSALKLEAENKSLKTLLNVKLEPGYDYITARVMVDSGGAFVKSLLISAGAVDGIQKGQAVLSGDGLVGRVIEVGQKTSRVLLVTDINSRVPVLIEGSTQHAVLSGENNISPKLIHLPHESVIEENARVVTSGYGGVFPKGLPVGRVELDSTGLPNVTLFSDLNRIVYLRIVRQKERAMLNKAER